METINQLLLVTYTIQHDIKCVIYSESCTIPILKHCLSSSTCMKNIQLQTFKIKGYIIYFWADDNTLNISEYWTRRENGSNSSELLSTAKLSAHVGDSPSRIGFTLASVTPSIDSSPTVTSLSAPLTMKTSLRAKPRVNRLPTKSNWTWICWRPNLTYLPRLRSRTNI